MSLMLRRYAKSTGYARPWFYAAMALGFAALAVWAAVAGDWIVMGVALAMITASIVAIPLTRRLARGLEASKLEHQDHTAERRLT
jgi:hypothetical protein